MKIQASTEKGEKPQSYYNDIKDKFAEERDLRLNYRPEGRAQFITDLKGDLAKYETDPNATEIEARDPINDTVEVLFIGGGFSALLTAARLRKYGVESIRIVEKGTDVGGVWYWNRYPGVACDVVAYDYLPLLDELDYVPLNHYARGSEILSHCQTIAKKYDLYDLATFQTTVTSTRWNEDEGLWHLKTDRGDEMKAKYVICANGTMSQPKLSRIDGMESFEGESFHTSRWNYNYTGAKLENLRDKTVGIIGTGASAVQAVPELAKHVKQLYVFQRTPSAIDVRDDYPTDPNWARKLQPGWQKKRRAKVLEAVERDSAARSKLNSLSKDEKVQYLENANIDQMMRIHKHIEQEVHDPETAEALKPWYMFLCKRPCFHNDYLPAFNQANVELVDTHGEGITQISPAGPVFKDKTYEVDLLIYATGFEVQKTGTYNQIVGQDDQDLEDKYQDGIRTLLGIHSQGYPNLFIMGGYQAPFQFNLTEMLELQGDHIAGCIDYMRENQLSVLNPTTESEDWWVGEVIKHRGKTSRNKECTPGYYNFEGEDNRRQDGTYNGGFRQYFEFLGEIRSEMKKHFELK